MQENKDTGFISLYRSMKKHWLWKDPVKFQWWVDILMTVNHSHKVQKVNVGSAIYECGRGQSIQSLETWAQQLRTSKDSVRNFLNLLAKDNMIKRENLGKTTRLTVCNYDTYQYGLHVKQTENKRSDNDLYTYTHPNNNGNNDNNEISVLAPTDFDDLFEGLSENPDQLTEKEKTKKVKSAAPKIVDTKERYRDFVLLKPEKEYKKLLETFGQEKLDWMLDKLNAYKQSKGKTYKSDYGAINSWVVEKLETEYKPKFKINQSRKNVYDFTNGTAQEIV